MKRGQIEFDTARDKIESLINLCNLVPISAGDIGVQTYNLGVEVQRRDEIAVAVNGLRSACFGVREVLEPLMSDIDSGVYDS